MRLVSLRLVSASVLLGLLGLASALSAQDRVQITLLSTTDLHGHIYPIDYGTGKPTADGLAKLATLIKEARKSAPNTILVDSGDTIQGTPLAYYHNRKDNGPIDPMMLTMNALGYDAMAMGNHEYNFGLAVLSKARREANFPWLSSNTYRAGTDETAYAPYVIKELAGVRVGILGLTTPGIPMWENPENYAGLEFREPVANAAHWVPILREKEKVDLVVVAMHMGLEADLVTGRSHQSGPIQENAALALTRTVPGIDVVFMGHTHREIPSLMIGRTLLSQASYWGSRLSRADVYLARDASGRWQVDAKSAYTLPVRADTPADPEILALAAPYHEQTEAWLRRKIGQSDAAIDASDGYFVDNALIDLIQRAQLDVSGADVSFAANYNTRARVPAGAVTVRDIAGLYIYENTLYLIESNGAKVKAALEHAARFFRTAQPGDKPADLVNRSIPGYNFDIAEGVTYEIDLRRPVGDRIQNLRFKGAPLAPDQPLKVALNNYRYNGGGDYTMFKGDQILLRPAGEIRDLIIDWVEKNGTIPTTPNHNWKLVLPQ